MPLEKCQDNKKPGYRWGKHGKCYTYKSGNENSKKEAVKKAIKQGYAEDPEKFKKEMAADKTVGFLEKIFMLLWNQ